MAIKYDILSLVGLYFLTNMRRAQWIRVTVATVAMSVISISTLAVLVYLLPGGFDAERSMNPLVALKRIYWQYCAYPVEHPAFLTFTPLLCVAPWGLSKSDRFATTSFAYGLFLLILVAWSANFKELRAQMGIMLLLMPLTLIGANRMFARLHKSRELPDKGYRSSDES